MLYSRWQPDTGGYEYFEAPSTSVNINDDLPEPTLRPADRIGVPSIEAGRDLPPDAVLVGVGPEPVGLIAPVDQALIVRRNRALSGTSAGMGGPWAGVLIFVVVGYAAWHLLGKPRF
jgi:hypothetical protein